MTSLPRIAYLNNVEINAPQFSGNASFAPNSSLILPASTSFVPGADIDFTNATIIGIGNLKDVTLEGNTQVNADPLFPLTSALTINVPMNVNNNAVFSGSIVQFTGGVLVNFTGAIVVGLPAPSYLDTTLIGQTSIIPNPSSPLTSYLNISVPTTITSPTVLTNTVNFTNNVTFAPGSNVNFTGSIVTGLPAPSFDNVTLIGQTLIDIDPLAPLTSNLTVNVPATFINTAQFVGNVLFTPGITVDFTGVNVLGLAVPALLNPTLEGITVIDVDPLVPLTSTLIVNVPSTFNASSVFNAPVQFADNATFASGTTVDFTGTIILGLPAPSFLNITLTGQTVIDVDPLAPLTSSLVINVPSTLNASALFNSTSAFAGNVTFNPGITVDFTGTNVIGIPPPTTLNNLTLTGQTVIAVDPLAPMTSSLIISVPSSFNASATFNGAVLFSNNATFNSGTTVDLTGTTILGLPAPSFLNITLKGQTVIDVDPLAPLTSSLVVHVPSTFTAAIILSSSSTFNGIATFAANVTFNPGITVDFTGTNIIGIPPPTSLNNLTLTGQTSIAIDPLAPLTSNLAVSVPSTFTSQVNVNALAVFNNGQQWDGGQTINLSAGTTIMSNGILNAANLTQFVLGNQTWQNTINVSPVLPATSVAITGGGLDASALSMWKVGLQTWTSTVALSTPIQMTGSALDASALPLVTWPSQTWKNNIALSPVLPATSIQLAGAALDASALPLVTFASQKWIDNIVLSPVFPATTIQMSGSATLDMSPLSLVNLGAQAWNGNISVPVNIQMSGSGQVDATALNLIKFGNQTWTKSITLTPALPATSIQLLGGPLDASALSSVKWGAQTWSGNVNVSTNIQISGSQIDASGLGLLTLGSQTWKNNILLAPTLPATSIQLTGSALDASALPLVSFGAQSWSGNITTSSIQISGTQIDASTVGLVKWGAQSWTGNITTSNIQISGIQIDASGVGTVQWGAQTWNGNITTSSVQISGTQVDATGVGLFKLGAQTWRGDISVTPVLPATAVNITGGDVDASNLTLIKLGLQTWTHNITLAPTLPATSIQMTGNALDLSGVSTQSLSPTLAIGASDVTFTTAGGDLVLGHVQSPSFAIKAQSSIPGGNPVGSNRIWYNSSTNRLLLETNTIAYLSDITSLTTFDNITLRGNTQITPLGAGPNQLLVSVPTTISSTLNVTSPNLSTLSGGINTPFTTLTTSAANPGGASTLWYNSASDVTRPFFGPTTLALTSDLKTDTNPIADNLVVYADAAGNRKTAGGAGAISTINSVLNINSANLATVLNVTSANLLPTMKISSTNATSNRGAVGFGISAIGAWEIGSGSVSNLNDFYIFSQTKGNILKVNGTDGLINSTNGFIGTRYDVSGVAANPGAATTIWADSGNANALRYGAGSVLVNPAPTVVNAIPVYTGVAGQVNTTATITAATLARPITVSAGGVNTAATFNTTDPNCFVFISTTGATSNRGAVTFGRSAVGQWTIGSDKDNTNNDNFFIFRAGTQSLVINASDQIVNANYGLNSVRHDIGQSGANPGGTNTLWQDTSGNLRFDTRYVIDTSNVQNLINVTYSGTWVFSGVPLAASHNINVSAVRVGNLVTVRVGAFTDPGSSDGTSQPILFTPNAAFLSIMSPGAANDVCYFVQGGLSVSFSAGATVLYVMAWRWDNTNGRFNLTNNRLNSTFTGSTIDDITSQGGSFTYCI